MFSVVGNILQKVNAIIRMCVNGISYLVAFVHSVWVNNKTTQQNSANMSGQLRVQGV